MSAGDEAVTPAWGTLPVEQYLIREWDRSSELSAEEQRNQLVAAYIEEDVLDPELLASPPSRVPTAAEVAEILAPWRPQKLRRIAAAHLAGSSAHFYIVRTFYGGGTADDAKLRSWLDQGMDTGPVIGPENEWFCVLDDARLFECGDFWQDVYDVLPELAAPDPDRRFTDQHIMLARWRAEQLVDFEPHVPEDEHYEDAIREVAAVSGPPWLVVLDEEAFETEDFGLIFRDKKGNSVKETEVRPDMLGDFYIRSTMGMEHEGYWEHAHVGKMYRTRGKILRRLLPVVRGEE